MDYLYGCRSEKIPPDEENKYLVFESCLLSLFTTCPICNLSVHPSTFTNGTFLCITQHCQHCDYRKKWESHPMIKNTPAGNLLLSAAILFAGALPNKMLRVLEFLHCASIAPCTFYTHQRLYLNTVINNVWKRSQSEMIMLLQAYKDPLSIGGDRRSDSPGHSAKYGSYTC